MDILLSKSTWFIVKWVCEILGVVMNGIYIVLDKVGIPNIGLAIIFFTIIIYVIMTPIQIKQQKFSKMTAVMQPELQKIQKKYQGIYGSAGHGKRYRGYRHDVSDGFMLGEYAADPLCGGAGSGAEGSPGQGMYGGFPLEYGEYPCGTGTHRALHREGAVGL